VKQQILYDKEKLKDTLRPDRCIAPVRSNIMDTIKEIIPYLLYKPVRTFRPYRFKNLIS